jgi:methionyl-tRNA formyltransferase
MTKDNFRIVYMGTPEFAVTILDGLIKNEYNIVAVITAPDKPAGRGQKLSESDVKKYAIEHELNVLQPTNLKDEEFIQQLQSLKADLFVVVAFRMLPEIVWAMPPKGTINLHASILPNYRGAAPINWAIINGEQQTGVTTFFIEKEIDTGKIIDRAYVDIDANENVGELHDRLMYLGAKVACKTIDKIRIGDIQGIPQLDLIEGELKSAPKIFKATCQIDWSKSVQEIHDFCRGLSPYPAAWTIIKNDSKNEEKSFKIFRTEISNVQVTDSKKLVATKDGILFPCGDFYLCVTELQPEGKRRMNFKELLAGNPVDGLHV